MLEQEITRQELDIEFNKFEGITKTYSIDDIKLLYQKENNMTRLVYRVMLYLQNEVCGGGYYCYGQRNTCEITKFVAKNILNIGVCYKKEGQWVHTSKFEALEIEIWKCLKKLEDMQYIVSTVGWTYSTVLIKVIK